LFLPFPLEPLLPLDPLPLPLDPLLPLEPLVLLPAPLEVDPVLVLPPVDVELVPVEPLLVEDVVLLDDDDDVPLPELLPFELLEPFPLPLPLELLLALVELLLEPLDDEVSAISVACRCNSLWSALPTETVANAMPPPNSASSSAYSTADAALVSRKNVFAPMASAWC